MGGYIKKIAVKSSRALHMILKLMRKDSRKFCIPLHKRLFMENLLKVPKPIKSLKVSQKTPLQKTHSKIKLLKKL
jgi:hypothetical protein